MPKKTIIITGTTSGIGAQTAIELAKRGYTIYMLVRNIAKGDQAKRNILVQAHNSHIHIIQCDLADLASVQRAAEQIKTELDSVDVLINNAGGMFNKRELTKDGFEKTFVINHLGHFLLTQTLMPLLKKGKARIINISSEAHKAAKPNMADLQSETSYSSIKVYGNAKLFNIYFAQALAEKYADSGITAYSLHPGIVDTKFGADSKGFINFLLQILRPLMITPKQGAETSVYLATEPGIEKFSGQYFKKKKPAKTASVAKNIIVQQQLWDNSEVLITPFVSH